MLTPPAGSTGLTLVAAAPPVVGAAVPLAFAVSLALAVPLAFAVPLALVVSLAFAVSLALSVAFADLAVDAGDGVFEAAAAVLDSELVVSLSSISLVPRTQILQTRS